MEFYSVRHKGLRRLLEKDDASGVGADILNKVRRVLTALAQAANIGEVSTVPGWRLQTLKGDRSGIWSISVSGNWRITFRLDDNKIYDLDLEDYH
jgi:proteic killer suppression protein